MRNLEEILNNKKIKNIYRKCVNNKSLQIKSTIYSESDNDDVLAKFTRALNWEHLSISFKNKLPSWNCMQEMKEIFWEDEEVCFQLHPAKSEYINNHEYCLHIWKPLNVDIPLPPTILVGFRNGKEKEDLEQLKKIQYELGNPITDKQAELMYACSMKDKNEIDKILKTLSLEEMIKLL